MDLKREYPSVDTKYLLRTNRLLVTPGPVLHTVRMRSQLSGQGQRCDGFTDQKPKTREGTRTYTDVWLKKERLSLGTAKKILFDKKERKTGSEAYLQTYAIWCIEMKLGLRISLTFIWDGTQHRVVMLKACTHKLHQVMLQKLALSKSYDEWVIWIGGKSVYT